MVNTRSDADQLGPLASVPRLPRILCGSMGPSITNNLMTDTFNRSSTMHAQKHHAWVFIFGGLLSFILVGCAANVGKTIKVSDEQLAKYDTLSAVGAVAELEKHVNDAKAANMPFFAPDYFRGASEILLDAQKSPEKKPKEELINNIAKADAILDKGQTMMAIVQSRLVNELAMKNQLDKDNVAKVFPKEYEKSISELSSLIEKVELEKADNLDKDKIELIKMMQALDVKAIQYIALHDSEAINEDTQSKDAEKQAPATFAEALRVYKDAGNRISQAPHDEELVKHAGADALFAANHARYVNERVVALQNQIKEAIEPVVLEEEKRLLDISTALGHKDVRDQPIGKQAQELAQVAGGIAQGQQKSQQEIGAVSGQSKALEASLKEANDALKQANAQLAEKATQLSERDGQISGKDAQLKTLSDQVAQLEEQNKSLVEAQAAKAKTANTRRKSSIQ